MIEQAGGVFFLAEMRSNDARKGGERQWIR